MNWVKYKIMSIRLKDTIYDLVQKSGNSDKLDDIDSSSFLSSLAYNYTSGCLVRTDIPAKNSTMITFRIEGNTYGSYSSGNILTIGQFYDYSDFDYINFNTSITHFGYNFGDITLLRYNGYVYLWFKQTSTYQSFIVKVFATNSGSVGKNRVISISNSALPTGSAVTSSATITPKTIKDFASGTWAISISGNAATASSVAWGNITGKPSTFTPATHTHNYAGSSSAGGSATSADKLTTARTISLTGAVTGSGSFNGTANLSIATTVNHNHNSSYVTALGTSGNYLTWTKNGTTNNITVPYATNADTLDGYHASSFVTVTNRQSLYTTGTAPYAYVYLFRIANTSGYSTTRCDFDIKLRNNRIKFFIDIVANQYPYGSSGSYGTSISIYKETKTGNALSIYYIPTVASSGYNYYDVYCKMGSWQSGQFDLVSSGGSGSLFYEIKKTYLDSLPSGAIEVGDCYYNKASVASKLETSRTISLTGSVTGSGSFDGSGNLSIATTTNHTHNYTSTIKVGTTNYTCSSNVVTIPAYPTSLKCPNSLTIQGNGTSLGSYDGSAAKTINITPSSIGAAAASHSHSYVPLSGGTMTGALGMNSKYIIKPSAEYTCSTSSITGAICIAFPASVGNTMTSMWIDVYNYVTSTSFSVHVGGYTYSNSTWANNPFAVVYGANHKIRLGHNGTSFCIYIGETTSKWAYPQVVVRDVLVGYSPTFSNWVKAWTISFVTSFSSVTATLNDYALTTKNWADLAAAKSHTHSYAGSSSAGGAATSANKINTNAGSATNPVYFSGGIPVACTYSLNKTVPSDAKFTDTNTTYSAGTGISLSGTTFSNSGVRSVTTGSSNGTISVNTNGTSANVAVKGLGSAAYTASTAYAAASHSHAWSTITSKPTTISGYGITDAYTPAKYNTTASHSGYYKIKINSTKYWMMGFRVRVYKSYQYFDIRFSGYNYGANYWYSPVASLVDGDTSITVYFGYDSASNLWVGIPAGSYTGIEITDATNGYNAHEKGLRLDNLFTITQVSSLGGTTQSTQTIYPPARSNHTHSYASSSHNHDSVYSKLGHTHSYAGSASAGGAANNSLKWGGYSIVVGSTGTDANTIYLVT